MAGDFGGVELEDPRPGRIAVETLVCVPLGIVESLQGGSVAEVSEAGRFERGPPPRAVGATVLGSRPASS